MGLFSRRKKNGGTMKTIVLSALTPHRDNDRFQRQENNDGDYSSYQFHTDHRIAAPANRNDIVITHSVPPIPDKVVDSVINLRNATNMTTPTASLSHDRDSSDNDSNIVLPPKLFRRTVGFPMLVRDFVGSSSIIHNHSNNQMKNESLTTTVPSNRVISEYSHNNVDLATKQHLTSNRTEVYSKSRMESESDIQLLHSGTPSSPDDNDDDDDDDMFNNDSFGDESEAMIFLETVPLDSVDRAHHEDMRYHSILTNEPHQLYEWFPSTICLLSLDNDRSPITSDFELSQKTKSAWMKYFVPVPQCIVRNGCIRHVRYHSTSLNNNTSTNKNQTTVSASNDTTDRTPTTAATTVRNRFRSENHIHNKDTSSMILYDPSHAKHVIMDFCRNHNYHGAIVVAKNLLRHHQSISHNTKGIGEVQLSTDVGPASIQEQILTILGQLTLLCLVAGRSGEAIRYSTEAIRNLKQNSEYTTSSSSRENDTTNDTEEATNIVHSVRAVDTLLRHGLVLFSTNKVSQAMKACREALQMAIAMNGYEDTIVSVLLCNIGVFHLESGDIKDSVRSFEESLEIQRSILRTGEEARQLGSADEAIHRLTITMCNLATAYEGIGQVDRTISLLEESMTLYESIELDTSVDEEVVGKHLQILLDQHKDCDRNVDTTVLNTSDETEDDNVCQFYTLNQRRNSDAMQSCISSTFVDDDEAEDRNEDDDEKSDCTERSATLFGNSDGVPSHKVRPWLWLEKSDNHDFLLLGSLEPELSAEQRVRETVLFWNGDTGCDCKGNTGSKDSFTGITGSEPFGVGSDTGNRTPKCKLNFKGETVVDADLHLNEIHKQAMIYLDENQIDAAVDLLHGAVRSHCAKYGTKHHLVGSAMHNIGMVLFFAQRYSEALAAFENAVLIRDESLHPNHPDIQSSWIKIALIHLAMGNTHRAHDVFSDIRDKLLQNLNGYGLIQLAKVNNNIGVIAYEFNDLDNAIESFKAAYDCQRQIWKKCKLDNKRHVIDDDDESCNWHVIKYARANTLCNMAFVYVTVGDYERGLELYDHAYSILYRLLPKHHPTIVNVVSNIDLLVEAINDIVDK